MPQRRELEKGAYILADLGGKKPLVILMASGSEVAIIVEAGERLAAEGIPVRLVSFPSWDLFEKQDSDYRSSVFPEDISLRISLEAGVKLGWERYIGPKGISIGLDHYGASAPIKDVYAHFGLTAEAVVLAAHKLIGK